MIPRLVLLLTLPLIVLAACGDAGDAPSDNSSPAAVPDLDGTTWVAQSVTEDGAPYELAGDLRFSFDDGTLLVTGGCNSLRGPFTLAGDKMTVGTMASTMMACEQPLMDQDTWVSKALSGGTLTVAAKGDDGLTISTGNVEIVLQDRKVAAPDLPLAGTEWKLTSIRSTESVASVPGEVKTPTVTITAEGDVTVFTGCNTGSGKVEIGDNTLKFGPLRLTRMACTDEDSQKTEAAVLGVLTGDTAFTIEEQTLRIDSGDRGLEFRGDR